MAIPSGCRIVCRRTRDVARRVTSAAVGRFARYAWLAGESCDDIKAAIQKNIPQCEDKECNCEDAYVQIGTAIGALAVVAAAIATRGRSVRQANAEYEALLQRLRRTAEIPVGTITTVEEAAAINAAFAGDLIEFDRQIQESIAKMRSAQEAAKPRAPILTIEVIGGNDGN